MKDLNNPKHLAGDERLIKLGALADLAQVYCRRRQVNIQKASFRFNQCLCAGEVRQGG